MNARTATCMESRWYHLFVFLVLVNTPQGVDGIQAFQFNPYKRMPDSNCDYGLMTNIDELQLTAYVDLKMLPGYVHGIYQKYYYLMYENPCSGESNVVCRFNLNNPEFYCNPSQVGMECYCGPVTDNIVTLIVNVTVMLDYDRADFFFTYGPVQDLDLSDVMHLPERVFAPEKTLCIKYPPNAC
ncbi:hypothetical protein BgiBS90_032831 [Biomphalaria glabrata]|nr:hypothetical protein BgiBS90_032831 [Biomphalaria glabrata]